MRGSHRISHLTQSYETNSLGSRDLESETPLDHWYESMSRSPIRDGRPHLLTIEQRRMPCNQRLQLVLS